MKAPSSATLSLMQGLRRSWERWLIRWTRAKAKRAQRRLTLLQQETDSQLLRVKELRQRETQLEHRQQEMAESQQFRQGTMVLPEQPMTAQQLTPEEAAEMRENLRQVLGR